MNSSPDQLREQMLRYLDGTLSEAEIRELNHQLQTIPAQRREFAELLRQQIQLSEMGTELADKILPLPARPVHRRWARLAALAACLAVLLTISAFLFPVISRPPAFHLAGVTGEVWVQRGDVKRRASVSTTVLPGDKIQTFFGASADLQDVHDATHFHLREESTFTCWPTGLRQWSLERGTLEAKVAPQWRGEQLSFITPQAKAVIVGTEFLLASDAMSTHLAVTRGRVQLSRVSGSEMVEVPAKYFAVVTEDRLGAARSLPPKGAGTGLLGEYFAGKEFNTPTVRRFDPNVQFDWSTNRPVRGLDADHFLVRWTGSLEPRFSERYTFDLVADDGVRLWVDGRLLVNQWVIKSRQTNMHGEIALVAGQKYDLKLEYFESSGKAFVSLYWQSESQPHEIIPTSQLYIPNTNIVLPVGKP